MKLEIKKGDFTYLNDCKEALLDSELGKRYFTEDSASIFLALGLSEGDIYVCLDDSRQCAGYIWIDLKGAFSFFPYVRSIVVNSSYRGKGIGTKLMSYYEKIGFAENSKIFILVGDFNPRAKNLYMKLGYQEIALIPNLYKPGLNEFLMMKEKP